MNKSHHTLAAKLLLAAGSLTLLVACGKPPIPVVPVATAPAKEISDLDVTESVKTALLSDEATKSVDITVVSLKGDVKLSGIARTQAQIDRAVAITHPIAGVHAINNQLTLMN